MPLGRTKIVTESGARIARFSFANKLEWEAAPFKLIVRAWPEEDMAKTTSGSVQFFVGMNEEDIQAYSEEYDAYIKAKELRRQANAAKEKEDPGAEPGTGTGEATD